MNISLQRLSKDYLIKPLIPKTKDTVTVTAINDLSIDIPSGVISGIVGPSGCGKSTLLRMIAGTLKPTAGGVFFNGKEFTRSAPAKRGVSVMTQRSALFPFLTVEQNISLPLRNLHLTPEESAQRTHDAAELAGIEGLLSRYPHTLSAGERRRVLLMRAVVTMPKLLLLDDPFASLDARLKEELYEEIRVISRQANFAVLLATGSQEDAMSFCDFVAVLKDGTVCQSGAPQSLYDNPSVLSVAEFFGAQPINLFKGRIRSGVVHVGAEVIGKCRFPDQDIVVGIRPDGFAYDPDGVLTLDARSIGAVGGDRTMISAHPSSMRENVRTILPDDLKLPNDQTSFRFNLKPNKVFLFNAGTGLRLK